MRKRRERPATPQELEAEISQVCAAAKRYAAEGNEAAYEEAHRWIDDDLTQLQMARMMMSNETKY